MYDKAPLLATQKNDGHGSSAAMIQYGMPGATAANLRAGSAVQNFFFFFFFVGWKNSAVQNFFFFFFFLFLFLWCGKNVMLQSFVFLQVLFDERTLHCALPNVRRDRCTITTRYAPL